MDKLSAAGLALIPGSFLRALDLHLIFSKLIRWLVPECFSLRDTVSAQSGIGLLSRIFLPSMPQGFFWRRFHHTLILLSSVADEPWVPGLHFHLRVKVVGWSRISRPVSLEYNGGGYIPLFFFFNLALGCAEGSRDENTVGWNYPVKSLNQLQRILKILVTDPFFIFSILLYHAVKKHICFLGEVFPSWLCFPVARHTFFVASRMGDERVWCILPSGQCGFLLKNADSSFKCLKNETCALSLGRSLMDPFLKKIFYSFKLFSSLIQCHSLHSDAWSLLSCLLLLIA